MSTECAVCGKAETKLLKCGRCTSRSYCGKLVSLVEGLNSGDSELKSLYRSTVSEGGLANPQSSVQASELHTQS
jgi:hypothetical protein